MTTEQEITEKWSSLLEGCRAIVHLGKKTHGGKTPHCIQLESHPSLHTDEISSPLFALRRFRLLLLPSGTPEAWNSFGYSTCSPAMAGIGMFLKVVCLPHTKQDHLIKAHFLT
jgi:hypothetical protein